jgi:large subunit ribosomal protein L6
MSRVGKIPVKIPQGVKVTFADETMVVEGPKGKLTQKYHSLIHFEEQPGEIIVTRQNEEKQTKAFHGLYRNLLHNMVVGVSTGFSKSLLITGVGYRAEVQGNLLVLSLGYSSDIFVGIPDDLTVTADNGGKITVSGIDKQKVGELASQIRKLRAPEPYKGKGIRYENEQIRRKVGKSGVK